MKRNISGQLILNGYKTIDDFIKGRKNKQWFIIDGVKYLFKESNTNYEAWSEVLSYYFAKQCGINSAKYDLAVFNNRSGVVTENFLNKGEKTISGDVFLGYANTILKENNSVEQLGNSVEGVFEALSLTSTINFDYEKMWNEIVLRWAFDGLIMESDRNSSNWSFLSNEEGMLSLAPLYDTSTMARLNNDIASLVNNSRVLSDITVLTDQIETGFTFYNGEDDHSFLTSFSNFCETYPEVATRVIKQLSNIDVDKAISDCLENINLKKPRPQRKVSIPWELSFWLNKVITTRLKDMLGIYNHAINNKNVVANGNSI